MRRRLFLIPLLLLSAPALAADSPVITEWEQHHPAASDGLAAWVQSYPHVAGRMFHWNRLHPLRGQTFVRWMVERPDESLNDFISAHAEWPIIDELFKPNTAALNALVSWGHAHAAATRDLASEPRGFAWVGFHVYFPLWDPTVQVPPAAPGGEAPATTPPPQE